MIARRRLALLAPFAIAALSMASARAAAPRFTSEALAQAKQAGKPILVEVSAPWCPACRAQKAVLAELATQDRFKAFVTLDIDFDTQKDALRAMGATSQSTLIVFKGDREVGRVVGVTRRDEIEALLARAL